MRKWSSWSIAFHIMCQTWWRNCCGKSMYGCQWHWFTGVYCCVCWQKYGIYTLHSHSAKRYKSDRTCFTVQADNDPKNTANLRLSEGKDHIFQSPSQSPACNPRRQRFNYLKQNRRQKNSQTTSNWRWRRRSGKAFPWRKFTIWMIFMGSRFHFLTAKDCHPSLKN